MILWLGEVFPYCSGGLRTFDRIERLMSKLLSIIIACSVLVATDSSRGGQSGNATSFSPAPRQSTVLKYQRWMSRIPKEARLSELSLPGTHDSCAQRDGASFGFAKCQTWKLDDQLSAGVRFIDIRCRHIKDRFQIHHGIIDQKMSFNQVRDVCRDFLKLHPTECIMMSVKEEATPDGNSRAFAETFKALTRDDGRLWHIARKVPELGEVRGRIVLIDRTGTLGGLPWNRFEKQDKYTAEPGVKIKLIRSHLEKAAKADRQKWFINFCSGTYPRKLITPRKYAAIANEAALEFLRGQKVRARVRLGTVVMDFPGEELIERIIESNFDRPKK